MKRKTVFKRILIILPIVIIMMIVCSLCINHFTAAKIPHRFAAAEEGRRLMLAHTDYYGHYTQPDIEFRMQKSGATINELLEVSEQSVQTFNLIEKSFLESRIAKMYRTLKKNGYVLPQTDEITFIKADMKLESGASGYTHGTEIYLNGTAISLFAWMRFIPGFCRFADELLWHELFHCLTRSNPDFRAQMYSLIHFTVADEDFALPPSVQEKLLSNPDVGHHDSYAAFTINGQKTDCFVALIAEKPYSEAQTTLESGASTVLIPIDGTDIYYDQTQAEDFYEVFGQNTAYVIDPEECMADNFAYAMLYGINGQDGKGYMNPEIIEGILDYVSGKKENEYERTE